MDHSATGVSKMALGNRRVVLCQRPVGQPQVENFRTEDCDYPTEIKDGHILVKTLYLSVDPYMRICMNADPGTKYVQTWKLGDTISGGGVGVVTDSRCPEFVAGDFVAKDFNWPWQLYASIPASQANKIDRSFGANQLSLALGALGMPGLTSLIGIRERAHIKPGTNQTFVVSAAAGACGSLAGQIAKLEGCGRVVGICGTDKKCRFLMEELGFDGAINYKTDDIAARLRECCSAGIDVYFDNVGGKISNEVIKQMNKDSAVIPCGQISMYSMDINCPLDNSIQELLKEKRISRDLFAANGFTDIFDEMKQQLAKWVKEGKIKTRETVVKGLENCGAAFIGMMNGSNIGKQVVHIADP
ncbi:prostaglandin reductase 2-like [Patiria miniata]|uniref:15-oxoprostaglandin 13-reductase n=1 Tax=Patiria miniata TaxID=46514 RepID=A0A914BJ13_PATMI|nr:prostaglandin reductase 2-like [Patiria miniata]